MQLRTPRWFSIRPQISLRQTNYTARQDRDPITFENFISPEAVDRFYAQGQVEIVGPSLSRTVNRSVGGFTRFKHVIEPRFRYLYTSDVQNQEDLIRFDTVDSPFLPIVTTEEAERELVTVYRNHHSIVVRPRNAVDSEPRATVD